MSAPELEAEEERVHFEFAEALCRFDAPRVLDAHLFVVVHLYQ